MPYDVLVNAGRVLDAGAGIDGPLDIAISAIRSAMSTSAITRWCPFTRCGLAS